MQLTIFVTLFKCCHPMRWIKIITKFKLPFQLDPTITYPSHLYEVVVTQKSECDVIEQIKISANISNIACYVEKKTTNSNGSSGSNELGPMYHTPSVPDVP